MKRTVRVIVEHDEPGYVDEMYSSTMEVDPGTLTNEQWRILGRQHVERVSSTAIRAFGLASD